MFVVLSITQTGTCFDRQIAITLAALVLKRASEICFPKFSNFFFF
jgi:hypothetical protein